MGSKTPEEELDEFLAAQPSWLQKLLQYDLQLTADEDSAGLKANLHEDLWNSREEYERLCQRVPARWRDYCKKRRRTLGPVFSPSAVPGRPRKDALAEEATHLYQAGKNYQQIATLLDKKYGLEPTSPDAIRKLIASRNPRSKPEKT